MGPVAEPAASGPSSGQERPKAGARKHAAPRHASRGAEAARFDTSRLPTISPEPAPRQTLPLLLLALGITAAVVAWGYLVYLAIDFGTKARDGESAGWFFLGLATIGAIACLFVAMMLVVRLVSRLRGEGPPSKPPRVPGGRRAAR
jgi:hypothetical protein